MTPHTQTADADESVETTHTTIEVRDDVWRQLRADAISSGEKLSTQLEIVLADYYGVEF